MMAMTARVEHVLPKLKERFCRIIAVEETADMLYWDQVTLMPEGGRPARAEQLAALSVLSHELTASPRTGDWLAETDEGSLDCWQAANLREMRRKHTHAIALGRDLVEAMSRAATACEAGWRKAKHEDDFCMVRPLLAEIVNLTRQAANAKSRLLQPLTGIRLLTSSSAWSPRATNRLVVDSNAGPRPFRWTKNPTRSGPCPAQALYLVSLRYRRPLST